MLTLFAFGASTLTGPAGTGLLHGLKLTAVAIVAQAVWGIARSFCPDKPRSSLAILAALIMLFTGGAAAQIGVILLCGLAGFGFAVRHPASHLLLCPLSRKAGLFALTA